MERAHNLLQTFIHTNEGMIDGLRLHLKIDPTENNERSTLRIGYRTLSLTASTPLSALFALHRFQIMKTASFAQDIAPTDRIIWPQRELKAHLENPQYLEETLCRLIALGYNGIILPHIDAPLVQSYGLKCFSLIDENTHSFPPNVDGFIFQLNEAHVPPLKNSTSYERLLAYIQDIEKKVPKDIPLILVLPCSPNAKRFFPLIDDVSLRTKIAFFTSSGNPFEDFEPPHPILSLPPAGTSLLPIINAGLINHGEGLWPTLPFELIESCIGSSHSGGIVSAAALPQQSGLLACSLWITQEALRTRRPPLILCDMWFSHFKPQDDFFLWRTFLIQARQLAVNLVRLQKGVFSKGYLKVLAESLWANVHLLSEEASLHQEKTSLQPCAAFFIRDAKRIIQACLEKHALSLPFRHPQKEDDLDGFWTKKGPILLDSPLKGNKDSRQEAIFTENRILPENTLPIREAL